MQRNASLLYSLFSVYVVDFSVLFKVYKVILDVLDSFQTPQPACRHNQLIIIFLILFQLCLIGKFLDLKIA